MTERMAGTVEFGRDAATAEESSCEFVVSIESDDIEAMIKDPYHSAKVTPTSLNSVYLIPISYRDPVIILNFAPRCESLFNKTSRRMANHFTLERTI